MSAHDHREFVEGCYRCDLSLDEVIEHKQTTDEREARQALDILHRYAFGSNEIGREQVASLVEVVSDALRRSEVPEPSAERLSARAHYSTLEAHESAQRYLSRELQTEPSDAQVLAAVDAFRSEGHDYEWRMRAALRAAWIVR